MLKMYKLLLLSLFTICLALVTCTINEDILTPKKPPILYIVGSDPLSFSADIDELTFKINNSGEMALSWSVSDNKSWLSVSPGSGSTTTESDLITVYVDRTGLSENSYSGRVSVTSNGGNETIDVTMAVVPELKIEGQNPLVFGTVTASLTFNIVNSGTGILNWNISEDKPWLTVSTNNGSTTTETDKITVTIDRTGLSDGDYSAQINVTSNGGNETVDVTMGVFVTEKWLIHDDNSFESQMTVGDSLGGWLWIRFSCPNGWNSTKVTKVMLYVNSSSSYDFDIDCWDDYDYQLIGSNYWYTPSGDFTNLESHTSQSTGWYTHNVSHTFQSEEFFIGLWCWDENGPYFGNDTHDPNIKVAGGIIQSGGLVVTGAIWGIRVYAETGGYKTGENIAIHKDKGKWLAPSSRIKQFNNNKIEIKKARNTKQEIFYEYDIKQIFNNKIKTQEALSQ